MLRRSFHTWSRSSCRQVLAQNARFCRICWNERWHCSPNSRGNQIHELSLIVIHGSSILCFDHPAMKALSIKCYLVHTLIMIRFDLIGTSASLLHDSISKKSTLCVGSAQKYTPIQTTSVNRPSSRLQLLPYFLDELACSSFNTVVSAFASSGFYCKPGVNTLYSICIAMYYFSENTRQSSITVANWQITLISRLSHRFIHIKGIVRSSNKKDRWNTGNVFLVGWYCTEYRGWSNGCVRCAFIGI